MPLCDSLFLPAGSRESHPCWCVSCGRAPCGHAWSRAARRSDGWPGCSRATSPHTVPHGIPSERPGCSAARLPQGSQPRSGTHAFLLGQTLPSLWPALPHPHALLGKEGFKGHQQAAGPQAVGELDASVHSCRRQTEELVRRVAELLHAVDDFPVLLVGKCGQRKAPQAGAHGTPRGGSPAPSAPGSLTGTAGMQSPRGTALPGPVPQEPSQWPER